MTLAEEFEPAATSSPGSQRPPGVPPVPTMPRIAVTWLEAAAVAVLLGVHFAIAMGSAREHSPVYDEAIHLTAGISYWLEGDFRLHAENGNLPQRWAGGWALLGENVRFPSLEQPAWNESDVWKLSGELFYRSGNDFARLLWLGRSSIALVSILVCLLVYAWSRAAWGRGGAFISLGAAAFCPNFIAHGHLITSDIFATLLFSASAWQVWRNLDEVTPWRTALGAILVAGLFLSKFSAPLFVFVLVLLVAARLLARVPLTIRLGHGTTWRVTAPLPQLGVVFALAAIYATVGWIAIWTAYDWRFAAARTDDPAVKLYRFENLENAAAPLGAKGQVIVWCAKHRLLPEAYLYGMAFVLRHSERTAFWSGANSARGWPGFFPYCWLVKTPLPTLGLVALASATALVWWRRRGTRAAARAICASELTPAWALLLVVWTAAILSTLNIGHRHILPTYPPLFVLLGAISLCGARRWPCLLSLGLLCWLAADCLLAFPNYISYFNAAIGTRQGHRHLVNSSLDWGQDLPQLKRWLAAHAASRPVYLAYFGTAEPAAYGVHAEDLLAAGPPVITCRPGFYCVSATYLQQLFDAENQWSEAFERGYRQGRQILASYGPPDSQRFKEGLARRDPALLESLEKMNLFQAGRLMVSLRQKAPRANIGGSILVFELNQAELDAALQGPR